MYLYSRKIQGGIQLVSAYARGGLKEDAPKRQIPYGRGWRCGLAGHGFTYRGRPQSARRPVSHAATE